MQWKKDLELLIKQSKALVTPSVDAPWHAVNAPRRAPIEAARTEPQSAPARPFEKFDVPAEPMRLTPPVVPMQWKATPRDEIKARVANFKAHQEKFSRDREDYYLQTLARTRSAPASPSSATPEKRLKD